MKSVVVPCISTMLPLIVAFLPNKVTLVDHFKLSHPYGISGIRLEGDGLPEWCEVRQGDVTYKQGLVRLDGDGVVRFTQAGIGHNITPSITLDRLELACTARN